MIRLFKAEPMPHTPFSTPKALQRLEQEGLTLVERAADADVIVARCLRAMRRLRLLPWYRSKKFLIWTHEPRRSRHFSRLIRGRFGLPDVHVMNAYTGDVYWNNHDFYGYVIDRKLPPLDVNAFPGFRHRKTVAIMSYRNDHGRRLMRDGANIDLYDVRNSIALEGHRAGQLDIFGPDWPRGISREDSRQGDWHKRKIELLQDYHFHLCFENTSLDYYCTEKLWDSLKGGCLPIYLGQGNKVYDDFPVDSFLDYAFFRSRAELFDYVERMTVTEFCERMNRCIAVLNRVYDLRRTQKYYSRFSAELLDKIVARVRDIVPSSKAAPISSAA